MINLLRAELTRMLSRKIVWIGFGVALLALAGLLVILGFQTRPTTAVEQAVGQKYFEQSHQDWQDNHAAVEQDCKKSAPADQCQFPEPKPQDYARQVATFAQAGSQLALFGVGIFGLTALIAAASLVGADFGSGTIANWLSFIPNRWRVYSSKLVVTVVGCVAFATVGLALVIAVLAIVVAGQQGGSAVTGWQPVLGTLGRGLGVIGLCSILGFTVAFITRRTIAALGIALGYLILRLVLSAFAQFAWFGKLQPWLPENNALAVIAKKHDYYVYRQTVTEQGINYDAVMKTIHWPHGLVYLLVAAAVLLAAGLVSFTRRDVT